MASIEAPALAKAYIIDVDNNVRIECQFCPKEYAFKKTNQWPTNQKTGATTPQATFGGGDPAVLDLELFFDTLHLHTGSGAPDDVREKFTDKLWKLMKVDARLKNEKNKNGRPPKVRFQWGSTWSFDGVLTSMTQKFTMFWSTGIPVRATVNVSIRQLKDEDALRRQNPTSGGPGGNRIWTVTEGDTLAYIAFRELGDTREWRRIAEANGLDAVRELRAGTRLLIPNA